MPTTPAPPPGHLSTKAAAVWRETLQAYDLAAHELEVFRLALEAMDRAAQARRTLRREGLYRMNRFDDLVPHPAIKVEKDAAAACSRMLAQLALPELEADAPALPAPLRRVS
jgi:phage terminase small subunit